MSHIFISYSRRDLDFAGKIVQALAENNLDTWIDWKSIPKGEDWEQEIYRGIEEADAFLFLISPDSVTSPMCNKEIEHAVKNGKRILPIFIVNVNDKGIYGVTEKFLHKEQKEEISRRNFIICREGRDDFNKAIEEIRTTIHTDYEWLKYHTRLQVKALDWERVKDNSRLLRGKELREAEQQLAEISNWEDPQPTKLQREYLFVSRRYEEHQRRQLVLGLGIGSLLLLGIAIIATWQWQRAGKLANLTLVRQLLAQVQLVQTTRLDQALLLSVEAYHRLNTKETRNNLLEMIHAQPELLGYIQFSEDPIALGYSPDGKIFIVLTDTGLHFWDAATEKVIMPSTRIINDHLVFTHNGRVGFSAGEYRIELWDWGTGRMQGPLAGQQITSRPSGFSPDGSIRRVFSGRGVLDLQNAETGDLLGSIYGDFDGAYFHTMSDNNRVFLIASDVYDDRPMSRIQVWELPESFADYAVEYGEVFTTSRADGDWWFLGDRFSDSLGGISILLSPDGKNIAIVVQKTSEIQYLLSVPGESGFGGEGLEFEVPVSALSSECNDYFAIGRDDGLITFDERPAHIPNDLHHPGRVEGLIFSPDCTRLASWGNGNIILWDFNPGNSILWLGTQPAREDRTITSWNFSGRGSAYSLDGKTAVSSCLHNQDQFDSDSPCYLSEVQFEGVTINNFPRNDKVGDASVVTALALNANGEILALGICRDFQYNIPGPENCYPGEVWLVWKEVSSSKVIEIHLGDLEYAVISLDFDPDGNILTAIGQDGTVAHWDMNPTSWQVHACELVNRDFTETEWRLYIGDEVPHTTCSNLPIEPEVIITPMP